jgi:hypothetical protein
VEQSGAPTECYSGYDDVVTCLWCGSTNVERLGEFGPGLMTEQWMCLDCHGPFEWIRKR